MTENTANNTTVAHANQRVTSLERRNGHEAAILTLNLDLENLDNVADELLKQIAQRIHQRLRASDVVVQLDDNEFVVLLKDIRSPDNADSVSHQLIDVITQPFELKKDQSVKIDSEANVVKVEVSFYPQSQKNN